MKNINHDQKSQGRIYVRNSEIWWIQKIHEKKIARCDSLCYFVNKKLSVVFKRLWKCNEKWLRNTENWWIEKQDIEFIINIKKRKIWVLIDSASDINYMNSQLWKSLEIKEKEWKQLLIMRNAKWNKIIRITKETEKTKMNIVNHQEQIVFSKMKMLKHKIMLEMNWLWWYNSRIDWKQKRIIMKNCKCKIRQTQMKSWMKVKKQISQQY